MGLYILTSRDAIKRRLEEYFFVRDTNDQIKNALRGYFDILNSNKIEMFYAKEENEVIKFLLTLKLSSKTPNLIKCYKILDEAEFNLIKKYDIKRDYSALTSQLVNTVRRLETLNVTYKNSNTSKRMTLLQKKLLKLIKESEEEIEKITKKYIPFEYKIISD